MFEEPPRYKTFLLTVWEERNEEQRQPIVWRFGLEDPQTGQRRAFSDLEALSDALRWMTGAAESKSTDQPTDQSFDQNLSNSEEEQEVNHDSITSDDDGKGKRRGP